MSQYHRSARWLAFTAKARPIIARTLPAPCVDPRPGCSGVVSPGDKWDVSHLPGYSAARNPWMPLSLEIVGPAHRGCNRTNGARDNRQRQLAAKREDDRLPSKDGEWWS